MSTLHQAQLKCSRRCPRQRSCEILLWGWGRGGWVWISFYPLFFRWQESWIEADVASNQIPKGKCRVDGASLAQMSWDSGLRSGAAPQVSGDRAATESSRTLSATCTALHCHGPSPWHSVPPRGADNPTKGLVPESGHWKVLSPAVSLWVCRNLLTGPQGADRISL